MLPADSTDIAKYFAEEAARQWQLCPDQRCCKQTLELQNLLASLPVKEKKNFFLLRNLERIENMKKNMKELREFLKIHEKYGKSLDYI